MKSERNVAVDCAKTMAIFAVMTVHVTSDVYLQPIDGDWLIGNFFGSISRACVPLFLMCTGVLLLDGGRERISKEHCLRKIPRLLVSLFFWATVYKFYNLSVANDLSVDAITASLIELLTFNHHFHLYYLHIVLIVYLFLPAVNVFTSHADQKAYQYVLVLWFTFGILFPFLLRFWPFTLLTGIPLQWSINMVYAAIGYCMVGYYLSEYPLSAGKSVCFVVIGFLIVYCGTLVLSVQKDSFDDAFLGGMSPGPCLLAIGLFGGCRYLVRRLGDVAKKTITYISKASFCIYLVHMLFLHEFFRMGINAAVFPCMISIPAMVIACFGLSLGTYFVLSKIPVIRKWII